MASYTIEEVESLLLHGQQLTDNALASIKCSLGLKNGDNLRNLSRHLRVRLTEAVRKGDIAERLLGMARIGQ